MRVFLFVNRPLGGGSLLGLPLRDCLGFEMRIRLAAAGIMVALCACLAADNGESEPRNVLAPFFEKVQEKGFPVAGWAFRDKTAAVDVAKGTTVTRYSFDAEGKITSAPRPGKYDRTALLLARFSAAAAAESTLTKLEKGEEVRAVTLVTKETGGMLFVAVYDRSGRFLGRHRFFATDGRSDGYDEGIGERDPLEAADGEGR